MNYIAYDNLKVNTITVTLIQIFPFRDVNYLYITENNYFNIMITLNKVVFYLFSIHIFFLLTGIQVLKTSSHYLRFDYNMIGKTKTHIKFKKILFFKFGTFFYGICPIFCQRLGLFHKHRVY